MSYSEYKAYMDMFKPKYIIKEDDDELTLDDLNDAKDQPKTSPEKSESKPESSKPQQITPKQQEQETKSVSAKPDTEFDMKFSVDLATEFSNTINEFTTVCAKIVEKRIINKELSDKFYEIYGKIKNLADAASKTE